MMHDLFQAILPVIPYLFVLLVGFALFVIVFLFRKLSGTRAEAESTRRALELELSFLGKIGRLFRRKTDVVVAGTTEDPNKLTISRPIPAVPPPEREP